MPRKNRHYVLTPSAERDFRQAKQWSSSRWGKELTKQYFSDLHTAAERLAKNHQAIREKEHLMGTTDLGIHPIREHYLVYVPISHNVIVIVALIRQTRDVPAILDANRYYIRRELQEIFTQLSTGKISNWPK